MTCRRCQHGTANKFGTYGKLRVQRFRCTTCRPTFTALRKRPLGRHYTDAATATQIVTLLMEGMSVRAVPRITGVHQGRILSILLTVRKNSRKLFDRHVRNIRPRSVQADQLWTFVHWI